MNTTLLNTLINKPVEYTPVWFMRQAGRYLPEYRKLREEAGSFLALCKNPELATQVTLQPLTRFNLDAAILFSDILVVPEAMGLQLYFSELEGPKFNNPVQTSLDVDNLKLINPEQDLAYVLKTIKNIKLELAGKTPLIGFSGSPWTLACYMLEGGSSKNFEKIKLWLYYNPELLAVLLEKISYAVSDYLCAQIKSGVDAIMLFDTWGGILTTHSFKEFSLKYMELVLNLIQQKLPDYSIPSIVFTKGGGLWLKSLSTLSTNAIGLDWTIDLGIARKNTSKILQGNLDPVMVSVAKPTEIKKEVEMLINNYKNANDGDLNGLIFNLGHGLLPSAKIDNLTYLCDLVHELTRRQ